MEEASPSRLDKVDRRILDLVQREGALSDAQGKADAPEWGRWFRQAEVSADKGHVIMSGAEDKPLLILDRKGKGRVALLDRAALGLDVTIFAHVKLSTQGRDAIAAFAEAIRERPEVLDCYTTMGEWDFMLRVVTRDIKAYEAFYLDHLSKLPYVQSINSSVTVTVIKETTILPIAL